MRSRPRIQRESYMGKACSTIEGLLAQAYIIKQFNL